MNLSEYESISPYTDAETVEALARVARHPAIPVISKYLFPTYPAGTLRGMLMSVDSIDEFQEAVMSKVVKAILAKTSEGLEYSGIENLKSLEGKKFVLFSNHRDIILDPAIMQMVLKDNDIPFTEICVGSNLLSGRLVEDLLRSNRMIKVIRGISARELYLSSKLLSAYIRESVTSQRASIWIAQKEGRAKDGYDLTEQGLLKMFDLSGSGDFVRDFSELNIIPVSISYEIESCDARKARELYIKRRDGVYVKKDKEDLHSILTGIRQKKGHIHLSFCKPLSAEIIAQAAELKGNERYHLLMQELDRCICREYRLWPNNYIAYDLMTGGDKYADRYSSEQRSGFIKYADHRMAKLENSLDKAEVRDIFIRIYGNPVLHKEELGLL
ncbi:MAG: 1-acyl-sn-glycerol-3-phosphate acyltransferase [Bacteroidales bacterium]|nr:1-acyl-sn-glycerol-3-phosphate acyltransferase [Candidatus Cryptobacteroides fimicaballi]